MHPILSNIKKILMSKDIRTKNVKKEKAVDKIKKSQIIRQKVAIVLVLPALNLMLKVQVSQKLDNYQNLIN